MLTQPLLDKLRTLRLPGLRAGLEEQLRQPRYADLSFEERLGLLIDIECARRDDGRRERRLQAARFALRATLEDLDLSPVRGLDRRLIFELGQGEWIERHLNAIVLGPTGAGKTYLACALGHAACKQGLPVRYERTSRLLGDLALAHADGSWPQALLGLTRVRLLILDDWLRDPLTASQTRDLLEVLDDRYDRASTLVATQVPIEEWLLRFPDPTLADAILDRLVHNAYRLEMRGESQRKMRSPLPAAGN